MSLYPLPQYGHRRRPKGHAKDPRGGPKVYSSMSTEVLKQRREEMLREAELDRLARASQAGRTVPRRASTVAWEMARVAGPLRKYARAPKGVG